MAHAPAAGGRSIGRYQVQKHLASGGMAEIYLATYEDRGAVGQAVVKVILRERAQDRKFIQMFLDEARVSSTFVHPHIAQLFEVGRDGDTYFYAMEYVHGDNVRALIERSLRAKVRMPLAVTLAIGTRVAAALHYAHEKPSASGQQLNTVHRDVTPSNIMLGFDGGVKLLDFGIARADSRAQMTQSGTVKGKFAYMSPEQCRGLTVDRRTDVFALGIVLYELSVQRRAFRADTDFETMDRIIRGDLIPPRMVHADYPRDLEAVLLKALATDPAARYQTAAELGVALAEVQRAHGLRTDEEPIAAMLRRLFPVETGAAAAASAPVLAAVPALPAIAPAAPAPAPMSLASMLAATVEPQPVAPAVIAAPMGAVPAPPKPATTRVRRASSPPAASSATSPATSPGTSSSSPPASSPGTSPATRTPLQATVEPVVPVAPIAAMTAHAAMEAFAPLHAPFGTPPSIEVPAEARFEHADAPIDFARHSGSLPVPAPGPTSSTGFTPPGAWAAVPPVAVAMPDEPRPVTASMHAVSAPAEERSHLGLWVAIAAVLAVGGVVAAVLVLSSLGIF